MQPIAPNVFIETDILPITIGAVLTDTGWVIIDTPPMPVHAHAWRQRLAEISDKPIQYLIATDAQRERILGNAWFDAPLIAQETAAHHMLNLKETYLAQAANELSSNDNELVAIASLGLVLPQVSYSSSLTLYSGDAEFSLLHRPGAMFGNSWVLLPTQKILFAGDSLILNQPPMVGEGISKAWISSLRELESEYSDWTLIPGRGLPCDSASAGALADRLISVRQRIAEMLRGGKPRSEVAAVMPELAGEFPSDLPQRDEMQRRVRMALEAVYDELRTNPDDLIEVDPV